MTTPFEKASNRFTSVNEISALLGHRSSKVRRAARRNPQVNPEMVKGFDLAENRVALNPEWLEWMLKIPDSPYVQRLAALNPNTKVVLLNSLVKTDFAAFVAQNSGAPITLLETLYNIEHLRIDLAKNPKLPLLLQQRLSTDLDWEVRETLAQNPHLDTQTIVRLLGDEDWDVQESLAKNPCMTPNWLASLASSDWFATREAVADHPFTPPSTLEHLVTDVDEDVAIVAALNANTGSSALKWCALHKDWRLRAAAAAHPNTAQDVLDELTKDTQALVATLALARGVDTSESELARLAKKNNSFTRVLAASHANTTAETLRLLAKRPERRIQGYVAAHPNTDQETRVLLQKRGDWDIKALLETVEAAAKPPTEQQGVIHLPIDARVRRALASRTDTHEKWFQVLATDTDRGVQLALAAGEATPIPVLAALQNDEMVRDLITRREDIPEALIGALGDIDKVFAADTKLSTERYNRLAQKQHLPVRTTLAQNPEALETTFDTLFNDLSLAVPRALLQNQKLSKAQQRRLAMYQGGSLKKPDERESSYSIRREIAMQTTDMSILLEQTRDQDFRVLQTIMNRADCSAEVLRALLKTQLERYRSTQRDEINQHQLFRDISKKRQLTPDLLELLSSTNDPSTWLSVAQHLNTNARTLSSLYAKNDPSVQNAVLTHKNTASKLLESLVFKKPFQILLLRLLAWLQRFRRLRGFLQTTIEQLCGADLELYKIIAQHPNTPAYCLEFFKQISKHSRDARFTALLAMV
jgi:hypothetical protein